MHRLGRRCCPGEPRPTCARAGCPCSCQSGSWRCVTALRCPALRWEPGGEPQTGPTGKPHGARALQQMATPCSEVTRRRSQRIALQRDPSRRDGSMDVRFSWMVETAEHWGAKSPLARAMFPGRTEDRESPREQETSSGRGREQRSARER
jgi:hypothetical protein